VKRRDRFGSFFGRALRGRNRGVEVGGAETFVDTGRLIVSNPDARTKDLVHLLIK
jgi:hypothetical protein